MAYLGERPSQTLASPTSQYFNGDGSTVAFTLNRAVNVAEDLDVFVNNVRQEPGVGKSYTAIGTTLTFDAAPSAGTDNVYVVYRGLAEVTTRLEHDPNAALAATTGTFSGAVSAASATVTGDLTVDTNTLYVDSTNNRVGIGTSSPQGVLDLGEGTAGTGIVWGGPTGTNHYGSIWSEYGTASIVIGAGLKGSTSSSDFIFPYTGTYMYSAIELDSFSSDGIKLYTGGATSRTAGASATKNERMRIDSSGRVTMPYQPAFCAYPNSVGTSQTATSILAYDTTLTNVGNHYNTSTYQFTAPVAGNYYFAFSVWTGSATTTRCGFHKNGVRVGNSTYPIGTRNQASANDNDSGFAIISLQANDVVDVRVYAGDTDIFATNSFIGYLIG